MASRKPSSNPPSRGQPTRRGRLRRPSHGWVWLYGVHAALAAAANPRRRLRRLLAMAELADRLAKAAAAAGVPRPSPEVVDRRTLAALLPPGAVHQGVAVLAEPLNEVALERWLADLEGDATTAAIVLDQAEDPRNVGAVLRAAAAFGARAVVVQDRHAPEATGALAKAASGALETVPLIRVTNLARTLRALQEAGFWCVGLDGRATESLAAAAPTGRTAFVLGAEGSGLRRLVRESCDRLVRIPIEPAIESLNLSTATAIALYEWTRPNPVGKSRSSPDRAQDDFPTKPEDHA